MAKYKTHSEMIVEALKDLGRAKPKEIMDYISRRYSDIEVKPTSFRADLIGGSINHTSTDHYPNAPKLLFFNEEDKTYELYDQRKHSDVGDMTPVDAEIQDEPYSERIVNILDRSYTELFNELRDAGRIEVITFHPSYCYEDFIEGISVESDGGGNVTYPTKVGVFKKICRAAEAEFDNALEENREPEKYLLMIDEINRGNIPKIFGELITLLEKDKRKGELNALDCTLPCSGEKFQIPPNLYIIGTMNTADASIALIDVALRRRFSFVEFMPDYDVLINHLGFSNQYEVDKNAGNGEIYALSIKALQKINARILEDKRLGRDKQIGHSYLWDVGDDNTLVMAWRYDILPLLEEYLYGRYDEIDKILKDGNVLIDSDGQGIKDFTVNELKLGLKNIIEAEA